MSANLLLFLFIDICQQVFRLRENANNEAITEAISEFNIPAVGS